MTYFNLKRIHSYIKIITYHMALMMVRVHKIHEHFFKNYFMSADYGTDCNAAKSSQNKYLS